MPLPCDSDESGRYDDLDESDEFIRLSEVSEADILSIVETMVPDAPFLKDLLADQLQNGNGKHTKSRRWKKSMISTCLTTWAQ